MDTLTYDEMHPAVRGALGMFEGLRRLGFQSSDIYAGVVKGKLSKLDDVRAKIDTSDPDGTSLVVVALRTQGKEFIVDVGEMDASEDEFNDIWVKTCKGVNGGHLPNEDFSRIYEESLPYNHGGMLLAALVKKGITIPWAVIGDNKAMYN